MQETRLWDAAAGRTVSMRSKEEAHDYRYFPEPDLPPLVVDAARIDAHPRGDAGTARRAAPPLRRAYALPEYDAGQLTQSRGARRLLRGDGRGPARRPKAASNWMMGELARALNEHGPRHRVVAGGRRRGSPGLIALIEQGTISGSMAKDVFEKMFALGPDGRRRSSRAEGLTQIDDESQIVALIADVLAANADAVAQYRGGKTSDVRLPRRPGDEGRRREGEPEARQRAAQALRSKRDTVRQRLSAADSLIETYHLSKLYSRGVYALRDLSLTIDKGEFLFLTGPSGAGKSTLLRLLLREDLPSEGELKVRRPRSDDAARRRRSRRYRRTRRLRLPGLPAHPALHRVSERRVRHARARRAAGDAAAQDVSGAEVGRAAAPDERASRRSCPAASSSASRSRARSSTIRSSCSPTSRPATSIPICRSKS